MNTTTDLTLYRDLLADIKTRVRNAQRHAALSANAEMLVMYWDIGRLIDARQKQEGWGTGVIPRLAADLKNELPEQKGFSESNLKRMVRFHEEYPQLSALPSAKSPQPAGFLRCAKSNHPQIVTQPASLLHFADSDKDAISPLPVGELKNTVSKQSAILPATVAKLKKTKSKQSSISPQLATKLGGAESAQITISPPPVGELTMPLEIFLGIPWAHHVILFEKLPHPSTRLWYARQAAQNGWSRETLVVQIKNRAHERAGAAVTNFQSTLPAPHAAIAEGLLKDPYIFDFFTLEEPFHERELETSLLIHIQKFLLELGRGFAFVGRQYRLEVGDREIHLDLLFYHLHLRCYIVIDLKKGDFKPEYAGKMNFYCSAADTLLRREHDTPTVGLILCQTKDRVIAEYALRDMRKPIGVADYELTRALPARLASSLPSIETIEAVFSALKLRNPPKHPKPPAQQTPPKTTKPRKPAKPKTRKSA